jgi:hypothetical protein
MKLISIAARLREVAINMEVLAARECDYEFPMRWSCLLSLTRSDDNALRLADSPAWAVVRAVYDAL